MKLIFTKIKLSATLFASLVIIVSCQSEKKWENPNQCNFLKEAGRIKTNYEYSYDIIPKVNFRENGKIVGFELYNYGSDLRVNKSALADIYSGSLAEISHYYLVTAEDVTVTNNLRDTIYGQWGTGKVDIQSFGRICDDVFISPLAFRQIQERSDSNYLILVRLLSVGDNSYFNGLFVGDYKTADIIDRNYSKVVTTESGGSFVSNNLWPHWHPLLTDSESKGYKSYLSLKSSGIDLGDNYILDKIKNHLKR